MQRIEHNLSTGETQVLDLTPEEEQAIIDAQPTQAQILQAQIADIDAQLKAIDDHLYRTRGTREMDLQVAAYFASLQGVTEPQLYAASIEYKRVKDAEFITAKALRDQRKVLDKQLDLLS